MNQNELIIQSSMDHTVQPSLFYKSENKGRPLLVGLHTWSFNRFNQIDNMLPYAEKNDFNLLLPEFRGPNTKDNINCKNACGSELAKQDIKDAVDYIIKSEDIDEKNIFLLGLSGGGHMALLVSAMYPTLFKAVGAFVPVCDLKNWIEKNDYYREHVNACCGGSTEEMAKRSPMTYAEDIAKVNLKIFHGKFDDCVPVNQSIELYKKIMNINSSARVFLDIFDGGHEIDMQSAMHWFLSQYKEKNKVKVTGWRGWNYERPY